MSPIQLVKTLVVVGLLGYLALADSAEARTLDEQELVRQARSIQKDLDQALLEQAASNVDQIGDAADEMDDLDDDDQTRRGQPMAAAANQGYQAVPMASDLKAAASHHHHGHGAKGWLDMGAWTGKKGAFGWYDKHPVGGKKGK